MRWMDWGTHFSKDFKFHSSLPWGHHRSPSFVMFILASKSNAIVTSLKQTFQGFHANLEQKNGWTLHFHILYRDEYTHDRNETDTHQVMLVCMI